MRVGEPLDEAVETETAEVVGHPALGKLAGSEAQEWSEVLAQVAVGEPRGQETEDDQGREERLDTILLEAEGGGALAVDHDRLGNLSKGVRAEVAIMADPLDVQETSIGPEADLPQRGQVRQPLADPEVARVVDGGLGP